MSAVLIARLLSAAGDATERSTRLAYLAEGLTILAAERERHRELALLLAALEGETVHASQTELVR
jgi:hypothetical protein